MRQVRGLSTKFEKVAVSIGILIGDVVGLDSRLAEGRMRQTDKTYPLVGGLFVTQGKICRHSLQTALLFLLPRPGA